MTPPTDWPALVRGIRQARGLTQQALADLLSAQLVLVDQQISNNTVWRWEAGQRTPQRYLRTYLLLIAATAGVTAWADVEIEGLAGGKSLLAEKKEDEDRYAQEALGQHQAAQDAQEAQDAYDMREG